ncbi:histone H1 [Sulfitobacter sp. S190]|uniref:histone H1 n=1 Tax=Sulfitobacter sp. S190 TaxID=2867022 RepID=UPI0021A46B18|nr:histone H1 [Sulfitobacter sp. S190]UWR21507.1 histone H1 [Sulfitobacter sp. S190]
MTDKPKRPRDANQLAKFIVDLATEDEEPVHEPDTSGQRKGGLKGGKAKARLLTPEQRSEAAQIAAAARWKKD